MSIETSRLPIQYSCYFSRSRAGEQFVPEHAISYVVSGAIEVNDGRVTSTFHEGELYFCRRNQLGKYTKMPPEGGEFRSVSVFLDQDILRSFSLEYGYKSERSLKTEGYIQLPSKSALAVFLDSLKAYEDAFTKAGATDLVAIKRKEALLLLLQLKPELKDVLFDFSEPGKIDLEAYMNQNYHFNVDLKRFAYLTGRSLSTFKRDFEKIYHATPSRWLLQRRLEEAHYLLKEKKKFASDIYLDLGFEDLSHFSFAFKKYYGVTPSMV